MVYNCIVKGQRFHNAIISNNIIYTDEIPDENLINLPLKNCETESLLRVQPQHTVLHKAVWNQNLPCC